MWLEYSNSSQRAPGIRSWIRSTMVGVASSWRPGDQQGRGADRRQPVGDVPVPQRPDHVELRRAVHRVVDGRLLGDLGERALHALRRGHPAQVPVVEHLDRGLVLGGVGAARLLVPLQRRLDLGRQLAAQPVRLLHPEPHVGRRVGHHHGAQPGRVVQGVLHREHPAPGLADHRVARGHPEVLGQRDQLVLEQLRGPELGGRVRQVLAQPAAELVVEHRARPVEAISSAIGSQ